MAKDNPVRASQRSRDWQAANPERARKNRRSSYLKHRDEQLAREKARRLADPVGASEKARRYTIKYKYGITEEQFDALLATQDGRCAVCRREFTRRPNIDHDHSSGRIRGLLDGACNRAIGQMQDDPALLRAAADYLEAQT
jgi:hypothetical protein